MPKTILIVDDSTSFRQVVGMALQGAGYEVVEACDGKDALTKLDGRKYHLIVSDVNMPNLDGIGFVKAAKEIAAYKFTPVVMLTSSREERDLVRSYSLGVNAFVVKPVGFEQFFEAIRDLGMFWAVLNEPPPRGSAPRP